MLSLSLPEHIKSEEVKRKPAIKFTLIWLWWKEDKKTWAELSGIKN